MDWVGGDDDDDDESRKSRKSCAVVVGIEAAAARLESERHGDGGEHGQRQGSEHRGGVLRVETAAGDRDDGRRVVRRVPADVVDRENVTADPDVVDGLAIDGEELAVVDLEATRVARLEGDVGSDDATHGDHRALVEAVLVDAEVLRVARVDKVERQVLDLRAAERELDVDLVERGSIARGAERSERRDDRHLDVRDALAIDVTEELDCDGGSRRKGKSIERRRQRGRRRQRRDNNNENEMM